MSTAKSCKAEGCKRAYRAKGYCTVHFHKWRRGELKKKPRYKTCCEENCRKVLFKFGMCKEHYEAWIASRKGVTAQPPAETPTTPPAAQETPPA